MLHQLVDPTTQNNRGMFSASSQLAPPTRTAALLYWQLFGQVLADKLAGEVEPPSRAELQAKLRLEFLGR